MAVGRSQASKYTKLLQGSFGVLAAAGVVVAAVGVSRGPGGAEITLEPEGLRPISKIDDAAGAPVDTIGSAARFATVTNAPKPTPPPPPPSAPDQTPETPTTPPVAEQTTKFLGVVSIGGRRLALMSVGGKQRFVGVGERLDDETISEINADSVTLSSGAPGGIDASRSLLLTPRGAEAVTYVTARAGSPVAVNPNMAAMQQGGLGNNNFARNTPQPARPAPYVPPVANPAQAQARQQGLPYPNFTDARGKAEFIDQVRERVKLEGNYRDEADLEERVRAESERIIGATKGGGEKGDK